MNNTECNKINVNNINLANTKVISKRKTSNGLVQILILYACLRHDFLSLRTRNSRIRLLTTLF